MDVAERCSSIAKTVLDDAEKNIDRNEVATNKRHLSCVVENLRDLNK
jgi:hypothetical protein